MSDIAEQKHFYHAEATALSGELRLPLAQKIEPQAKVKLPPEGGYLTQRAGAYRVGSVLSYESAYTQVAGNPETKPGGGWSTLTTAVVEGLNVLDVLTADRVVAQVSTEHPLEGHVPSITFLGTKFENLRIAGHEVKLDLNLDIFGEKPEKDAPYTKSPGFVSRVVQQHANIRGSQGKQGSFFSELLGLYNRVPESFENASGDEETVDCSLVNQAEGTYPGRTCGHVIEVPDFGTVYLAVLRLRHLDFQPDIRIPKTTFFDLTMIDIQMGCIGAGNVQACALVSNGTGKTSGVPGSS